MRSSLKNPSISPAGPHVNEDVAEAKYRSFIENALVPHAIKGLGKFKRDLSQLCSNHRILKIWLA